MKKKYEAIGTEKKGIIECENDYRAHLRQYYEEKEIGIEDFIMVGRTNEIPFNSHVDIHWSLNGLLIDNSNKGEYIIIEPLVEQIYNGNLAKLNELDTYFSKAIELSEKAIILMPEKKYDELCKSSEIKAKMDDMNIRLYEGEEELAVEMVFFDKNYIYLKLTKEGYSSLDENKISDAKKYTKVLLEKAREIEKDIQKNKEQIYKAKKGTAKVMKKSIEGQSKNYRMITGFTSRVEGDTNLGNELYASTDIGKMRNNQEDALLLIKDEEIPDFRMIVVADGMGGWQSGEVASDVIVNKLKEWFENLSEEEKKCYYTGVNGLKESLQEKIGVDIQASVESETWGRGGSTLVCAIIGKNDTMIANVGDSRAYMIKNGKLEQLSREDTVAQYNLERGKTPNKEASRFDERANELTQCIGMNRRELKHPHFKVINNNEYDILLLFSDGVTDCLSEDDIAVVCKNSNRKEVAKKLVEKAIKHDSIKPEEWMDYIHLNLYIPGGKDNTTAVAYLPKKEEIER